MLVAPFGYERSALSCVDSVVDTATFTGRAAFKVARDLQDIEDHNNKLRMLAASFAYERSVLPCFDSVVDSANLTVNAAYKKAQDFQEMVDYNKSLGMLVAPFGYERSALSCVDSVVDTATFATMSPKGFGMESVYYKCVTGDFAGFATFATMGNVLKR